MKGKLFGIGIGPGEAELLTLKAVKALKTADVICVPKSKEQASTALHIVSEFIQEDAIIEHLEFPMSKDISVRLASRKKNADTIAKTLKEGKNVAFLTLGDPMLYSTYSYVMEHLINDFEVETIPGIYSFAAISNTINTPLVSGNENLSVICNWDGNDQKLLQESDTCICMKISSYHAELFNFLSNSNGYDFKMITDVGKNGQQYYDSIEILKEKVPYFSTAIIKKKKA